jgi:poly-gamma-glutamate capsule biosynthesis protein CapA/YwtB (metallophosphatase superfamily)
MRRVGRLLLHSAVGLPVAFALLVASPSLAQVDPRVEWSLAATGDSIITRDIRVFNDPLFLRWVETVRAADVAFTNLECQVFRMSEFKGWPAARSGGGYERGEPEVALALKWAGFDVVSRANNHSGDYGIEGMLATNHTLDEVGLVYAGVDRNLGLASQPKYYETPKGRFALISFASTFDDSLRAGAVRGEVQGRPGLNPLRLEVSYELDPDGMAALRRLLAKLGSKEEARESDGSLEAFGRTFADGNKPHRREEPRQEDVERILRNVRSAARQADFVLVTTHSHEGGTTPDDPPDWLIDVAHRTVDAGATAFIVHGPHRLRGIEVYNGKPIFYSLGDFIFQYETTSPQSQDIYDQFGVSSPLALEGDLYDPKGQGDDYSLLPGNAHWWDGAVVVPRFHGHDLESMDILPIELGNSGPFLTGDGRAQRGTPRVAVGDRAQAIVDQITRASSRFGTHLTFEEGIGRWKATVR